nr:MAG TPA_asm: hypothetical protein [Caudoviricetes sp.]
MFIANLSVCASQSKQACKGFADICKPFILFWTPVIYCIILLRNHET